MAISKKTILWTTLGLIFAAKLGAAIVFTPIRGLSAKSAVLLPVTTLNTKNWGLFNKVSNSHIQALDAWKIEQGNREVVVAVIDTGIDSHHKDLTSNLWTSTEATKNFGWDFVSKTPNPSDDHGHGTHVAGIIGATYDKETGVSGVAQKVSIMAVKYYSEKNSGATNLKNTVSALNYAIDHGAKIINYSGGGPEFAEEEYLAIKRAEQKGILVVAAAGNESQNTDSKDHYYYPAAYGLSNTISVAAIDITNQLLSASNWGQKTVDVAAPGENIYSTLPGNRYGYMSGTSQATAFVSGLAALLLAHDSSLSPTQIKQLIKETTDTLPSLSNKISSGGKINAYAALTKLIQLKSGPTQKQKSPLLANLPGKLSFLTP